MYDELIEELRRHHCDAKEDGTQEVCEECAYDVIIAGKSVPSGIASVCVCGLMNRAADAIEELQAAVAGYEATTDVEFIKEDGHERIRFVPKWVSVNDRLPEFDKVVLVTDGKAVDTGWANEWIERDGERKVAWASPFADFDDVDSITHWMPLPAPPREETE